MCLAKRNAPCGICVSLLEITETTETCEEIMECGNMTEGEYLKNMNKFKELYDYFTERHNEIGCKDCIIDESDFSSESEYEEVEVEVEVEEQLVNRNNTIDLEGWLVKFINKEVLIDIKVHNGNMRMVYAGVDHTTPFRHIYFDVSDNKFKQSDYWVDPIMNQIL